MAAAVDGDWPTPDQIVEMWSNVVQVVNDQDWTGVKAVNYILRKNSSRSTAVNFLGNPMEHFYSPNKMARNLEKDARRDHLLAIFPMMAMHKEWIKMKKDNPNRFHLYVCFADFTIKPEVAKTWVFTANKEAKPTFDPSILKDLRNFRRIYKNPENNNPLKLCTATRDLMPAVIVGEGGPDGEQSARMACDFVRGLAEKVTQRTADDLMAHLDLVKLRIP